MGVQEAKRLQYCINFIQIDIFLMTHNILYSYTFTLNNFRFIKKPDDLVTVK